MGRFFFFRWNPPLGHFLFSIHIVITLYTVAFSLANSLSVRSHRSAITKNYSSRHPGKLQAFQFHSLELGVVIHKLIVLDDACPVFRFAGFHWNATSMSFFLTKLRIRTFYLPLSFFGKRFILWPHPPQERRLL